LDRILRFNDTGASHDVVDDQRDRANQTGAADVSYDELRDVRPIQDDCDSA
jgi:hypothetical protein|tara:strand:- start:339 stop:491 length:153 start_codon:yes stop_codon:yes gene_type:complete